MSLRFSEAPDPGSILSHQKGNKRYIGSSCARNKPSHFQRLKWEITNKPIHDSNFKIKSDGDASKLDKYGVLVQWKLGPSWI